MIYFVYFDNPHTRISTTEHPSLGLFCGIHDLSEDQVKYGSWDGIRVIIDERKKEKEKRAITLEGEKKKKIESIKLEFEKTIQAGFEFEGKKYDADFLAVQNIQGAYSILKAKDIFHGSWWDKNNTQVNMTKEKFCQFAESFFEWMNTLKRELRTKKDEVLKKTSIDAIWT